MTKRRKQRPPGSNWGDFGEDDQRGRMNLLTSERVLAGTAEVREGRSFCLSLPLDLPGGNAVNPKRKPPVFERHGIYYNYRWEQHHPGSPEIMSDECVTPIATL